MDINTAIMLGIFGLLGGVTWFIQGLEGVFNGLKSSLGTLNNVWALLLLALGVAGFLRVLIPREVVSNYLGPASGMKGYMIAWGVGAVTPGAPFTIYPIAATLLEAGSGIGQIMTMILSASIGVALTRVPYEVAFLGWRFSVLRFLSAFVVPLLGGLIAGYLSKFFQFG
ncbi:MAG: permease [Candidatus Bipolaricaulota bacterium]|nr:permease [Candidatus Bipolaricaulota bacterium]MBS3792838.1 permease [Candidatus Bipolaricaulota bacterium]